MIYLLVLKTGTSVDEIITYCFVYDLLQYVVAIIDQGWA